MEKIIETFENLKKKANLIDESMQVIPMRRNCINEFSELSKENQKMKILEAEIRESMKNHNEVLISEYKGVKDGINRVQLKMMTLLQYFEEQDKHKHTEQRAFQPIDPSTPKLLEREGAVQAFSETNTPRMFVDEYAKSPFAKKRTKVALQFSDFEAIITQQDFNSVPAYMRGRASLFELQDFLEILIRTFSQKYRILHLHRSSLKNSEWSLQSMFKSQEGYFEGQKFVTIGDLARILEKCVDKKHDRHLQMLRHLQIIREARKGSIICYIWLKK